MSRFFRPDRTRLPTYTKPRPDPLFHSYVPSLRFPVRPKRLTGPWRPGRRLAERAAELEVVATGLAGGRTDARRGWAGGRAGGPFKEGEHGETVSHRRVASISWPLQQPRLCFSNEIPGPSQKLCVFLYVSTETVQKPIRCALGGHRNQNKFIKIKTCIFTFKLIIGFCGLLGRNGMVSVRFLWIHL
jgi:hypothetical protein